MSDHHSSVIFVDDEANILKTIIRSMRSANFKVLTTTEPTEALKFCLLESVQIIVSDFRMPGINGVELLTSAKQLKPDLHRIILSGLADENLIDEALKNEVVHQYLVKPIKMTELQTLLETILSAKNSV